jgi:biopolymer transport protein ExbD
MWKAFLVLLVIFIATCTGYKAGESIKNKKLEKEVATERVVAKMKSDKMHLKVEVELNKKLYNTILTENNSRREHLYSLITDFDKLNRDEIKKRLIEIYLLKDEKSIMESDSELRNIINEYLNE